MIKRHPPQKKEIERKTILKTPHMLISSKLLLISKYISPVMWSACVLHTHTCMHYIHWEMHRSTQHICYISLHHLRPQHEILFIHGLSISKVSVIQIWEMEILEKTSSKEINNFHICFSWSFLNSHYCKFTMFSFITSIILNFIKNWIIAL